jgi:hypothetical protein
MNENNLTDDSASLNNKFEYDMKMQKLREEVFKKFNEYQNIIYYLTGDVPIAVLGLSSTIENSLLNHGCLRVYDLFNCDFTKIEGLNEVKIRNLTTSLNKFLSML